MDSKIALLIVGSLRNYEKTIDNLINNVIKPNNCDVFLYISKNNFSETIRTIKNESTDEDIELYKDKLKDYLKDCKILENEDISKECNKRFVGNYNGYKLAKVNYPKVEFEKNINCCYLNYKCWQMLEEYENNNNFKYDIIIRTRPDLLIKKEILLNCVDKNTFHYDRKSDFRDHPETCYISDYLCYGYRDVMEIYAKSVISFGLSRKNYVNKSGINISLSKEYQMAIIISRQKIKLKPGMLSKKGEHMSDTYALVIVR